MNARQLKKNWRLNSNCWNFSKFQIKVSTHCDDTKAISTTNRNDLKGSENGCGVIESNVVNHDPGAKTRYETTRTA